MTKEYDIERDLHIDRFQLDREMEGQAASYFRYGKLLAEAKENMDQAKLHVEITEARMDKEIRRGLVAMGAKVTEGVVESGVRLSRDYKDAHLEYIAASKQFSLMQTAVRAFDHKRSSLEGLIQLTRMEYYADPETRADAFKKKDEADKAITAMRIRARRGD